MMLYVHYLYDLVNGFRGINDNIRQSSIGQSREYQEFREAQLTLLPGSLRILFYATGVRGQQCVKAIPFQEEEEKEKFKMQAFRLETLVSWMKKETTGENKKVLMAYYISECADFMNKFGKGRVPGGLREQYHLAQEGTNQLPLTDFGQDYGVVQGTAYEMEQE